MSAQPSYPKMISRKKTGTSSSRMKLSTLGMVRMRSLALLARSGPMVVESSHALGCGS